MSATMVIICVMNLPSVKIIWEVIFVTVRKAIKIFQRHQMVTSVSKIMNVVMVLIPVRPTPTASIPSQVTNVAVITVISGVMPSVSMSMSAMPVITIVMKIPIVKILMVVTNAHVMMDIVRDLRTRTR